MKSSSDVVIVLPSLNPDQRLNGLIRRLIEIGLTDIVVVNDGSDAEHIGFFPDPDAFPTVTLLTHEQNRGKGAALKTAFSYIIENRPDCVGVVTADGDGQHLPSDILLLADRLRQTPDTLILGVRDFSGSDVPARSRFGNRMTSFVFKIGCGLTISDTQTGLRAIPFAALEPYLAIKGDRFEFETNTLLDLRVSKMPYAEQKITTVYLDENKTSHFHPIRDSFRIYKLILGFMLSSLSSAIIDLLLFYLFSLLFRQTAHPVLFSTVAARVLSSLYNYAVNNKLVFGSGQKTTVTLLRYYLLAVCVMLASYGGVTLLSFVFGQTAPLLVTLFKFIVDTVLFVLSFRIQREWVFGGK